MNTTALATTTSTIDTSRNRHAKRIRELSKRWAGNSYELGKELIAVRETFPFKGNTTSRPGWHAWIKEETGLSQNHALAFIRIAERLGSGAAVPNLSLRVLELLSRERVPDAAVRDVLERAKSGETIGREEVKEIIRPHLPTRAEAIKQAQETGKLVASRDGHIYSGATEDEMAAYSKRRSAVYGIRRAVDAIADSEFSPKEWIAATEPHWIAEFRLSNVEAAIDWLTKLKPLLEKKQGVV